MNEVEVDNASIIAAKTKPKFTISRIQKSSGYRRTLTAKFTKQ